MTVVPLFNPGILMVFIWSYWFQEDFVERILRYPKQPLKSFLATSSYGPVAMIIRLTVATRTLMNLKMTHQSSHYEMSYCRQCFITPDIIYLIKALACIYTTKAGSNLPPESQEEVLLSLTSSRSQFISFWQTPL